MEWNGLFGLVYGLLGGLFEFLPVSPQVHQEAFLKLTGLAAPGYGFSLAVHLGALAAVIVSYYASVGKLYREQKIAGQSKHSRKRQPDFVSLMKLRLLKIAAVPMVLSCVLTPWLSRYFGRMWLMAIMTVLSGIVVLLPHYMTRANKDARTLSPLDATLIGMGGIFGIVTGFSRVGLVTSVASMRGADREFALEFTYLLMIPALAALCIGDLGMIIFAGASTAVPFFAGALACVAAFGAGFAGIRFMRFLAVKVGYESLAYYSWGLAMFTFVLYLIG